MTKNGGQGTFLRSRDSSLTSMFATRWQHLLYRDGVEQILLRSLQDFERRFLSFDAVLPVKMHVE